VDDQDKAMIVEKVVICDAYTEPDRHYEIIAGGISSEAPADGRRKSSRYVVSSGKLVRRKAKGAIAVQYSFPGEAGQQRESHYNDYINELRGEVKAWREGNGTHTSNPYSGVTLTTRRLLEWWFERDEERIGLAQHRFFFAQREAVETAIYLYEVKGAPKLPNPESFVRYALKLATGTGKTVVMALLIVWATLNKQRNPGSKLATNFLVLVPNITVKDRVRGEEPHGDGLDPKGSHNLYDEFAVLPPEYADDFRPDVQVINWQAIPLGNERNPVTAGLDADDRFIPYSALHAMQMDDPNRHKDAPLKKLLRGRRDLIIINDEAHHAYDEKRGGKEGAKLYTRWSEIMKRLSGMTRVRLAIDLSATPWYGSGSEKKDQLFEWLVSDFSVYDAFESGLVKVVRMPDPLSAGYKYINFWDDVKGAKAESFVAACEGAIEHIYNAWLQDYKAWERLPEPRAAGEKPPVLLVVANDATRAAAVFDYLSSKDYLQNPAHSEEKDWLTIRVGTDIFSNEGGGEREKILRAMMNTVGKVGAAGANVRCIIGVSMLSEGWDVKNVTHILGLRAFDSPHLPEQVIGRGLRRMSYDVLNLPLNEREGYEDETVDVLGVPFAGFPVERRKRPQAGDRKQKPLLIEVVAEKEQYRIRVPNVHSWVVTGGEGDIGSVSIASLPPLVIDPAVAPPQVEITPVVGSSQTSDFNLDTYRQQYPLSRTLLDLSRWLHNQLSGADELPSGPTFEEMLTFVQGYVTERVTVVGDAALADIGIEYWLKQARDRLLIGLQGAAVGINYQPLNIERAWLDSANIKPFPWTATTTEGLKTHTSLVPCHTADERLLAEFLDRASDVKCYLKNERFGFAVSYYQGGRVRLYFPDYVVVVEGAAGEENWLLELKGEYNENAKLKQQAAELWCERMNSSGQYGVWHYLLARDRDFKQKLTHRAATFADLIS